MTSSVLLANFFTVLEVTPQAVAFWVAAPIAVIFALLVVTSRKPVHSALSLAGMMICLAVLYASLNAPFLFVTQIIVYTGAVLMLFLFVLMILGIDTRDSFRELIKGHRILAFIAMACFAVLLILAVGNGIASASPEGILGADKDAGGHIQGLARLIFSRYVYIFEATAALLITATMATMVYAHNERFKKKMGQKEQLADRMRAFAEQGTPVAPRPGSGVYARANSIEAPALLPDGKVAEESRSAILTARGAIITPEELVEPTQQAFGIIAEVNDAREGKQLR